jgi:cytochrome c oxidase subunit 2
MTALLMASHPAAPTLSLSPVGPEARGLADLGWFVLVTFAAVTVIMWLLIGWVAVRRRGSLTEHAPWNEPGDKRWIVIGGFAIPAALLGTIFVLTLKTMSAYPMASSDPHAMPAMIRITGHQWWWEVEYRIGDVHEHFRTANEIHIPAGQPVDIELVTADVIHSFWVPQLHGKVDLVPGFTNMIRIQADHPGLFRGQCAEYCGVQHAHMILLVQADAPADFDRWLEAQRGDAAAPAADLAGRGRELFMNRACVLCHQIRGTNAHGLVAPDLTHLASRHGIASNAFPNSTAYLSAWVTHAQSLKPGARMPDQPAFTGDELQALVAYLEGLK